MTELRDVLRDAYVSGRTGPDVYQVQAEAVTAWLAGRAAAAVAAVARVEELPAQWERWADQDHLPARAALNRARAADVRQALTDQCFPGVACGPCKTDERLSCPPTPPRSALDGAGDEPRRIMDETIAYVFENGPLPEPAGDEPPTKPRHRGEVDEAMDAGARFLEHLAASPNRLVREAAQTLQAEVVAERSR